MLIGSPQSLEKRIEISKVQTKGKTDRKEIFYPLEKFQENMPLVEIESEKIRPAVTPIVATKEVSR